MNTVQVEQFIENMKPFIININFGKHDITETPFYQQGQLEKKWDFGILSHNAIQILIELHTKYNLPLELIYIYKGVANEHSEISFKTFTFYSLKKMKEISDQYIQEGQRSFVDIGMQYSGMGYCNILAWHSEHKKFFFRLDGGSNGWDVALNFKKFIKSKLSVPIDKLYTWEQVNQYLQQDIDLMEFGIQ